tara:strand:+ start:8654 stop:9058 length:405 start_codon:yes stop_codon:yes gene_type:complete
MKDFLTWDVFENTNGHLSMIYRDAGDSWSVMNYNGSFYKVSKQSTRDYKFVSDTQKAASDFLRHYPQDKCKDYSDKVRYWEVYDAFFHSGFKSFPKRNKFTTNPCSELSMFPVDKIKARLNYLRTNHLLLLLLN